MWDDSISDETTNKLIIMLRLEAYYYIVMAVAI